jgi:uncharacterized protein (DUF1810 family)
MCPRSIDNLIARLMVVQACKAQPTAVVYPLSSLAEVSASFTRHLQGMRFLRFVALLVRLGADDCPTRREDIAVKALLLSVFTRTMSR